METKKVTLYFALVLLFATVLTYLSGQLGQDSVKYISKLWGSFSGLLISNGLLLFIGIAVLPALILPVSPLLALAGIWGETHGVLIASIYGTFALVVNSCWTYWIARIFGIKVINRLISFIRKKPILIPENGHRVNFFVWSLILRLTPGITFIFTNAILGALKMPFPSYIIISVPILGLSSFGYIYATAGIISGNFVNFGGGIAVILCFFIAGRLILKGKNAI